MVCMPMARQEREQSQRSVCVCVQLSGGGFQHSGLVFFLTHVAFLLLGCREGKQMSGHQYFQKMVLLLCQSRLCIG